MPSKSCALDPLPTWLMKRCIDCVLPMLTKIVNFSLRMGHVPDCMKVARVTPIIKKASLDPEVLSNYRPVSNLSFISKLNERVACSQLHEHLAVNGLYAPHQLPIVLTAALKQLFCVFKMIFCAHSTLKRKLFWYSWIFLLRSIRWITKYCSNVCKLDMP